MRHYEKNGSKDLFITTPLRLSIVSSASLVLSVANMHQTSPTTCMNYIATIELRGIDIIVKH
jgi:hypothetical protein